MVSSAVDNVEGKDRLKEVEVRLADAAFGNIDAPTLPCTSDCYVLARSGSEH